MRHPSKVTINIASLERQLFIANTVDQEFRTELLSAGDVWSALSRKFEEDTGVYFERQKLKQALYMYLYSAGLISMHTTLNNTFGDIPVEEVREFRDWASTVSNSPYLSRRRGERMSSATILRSMSARVYERYFVTSISLHLSREEIVLERIASSQRSLDELSRNLRNILEDICSAHNLGNTEGLFTITTELGGNV